MEYQDFTIKPYQQEVLNDLADYIAKMQQPGKRLDTSFKEYWADKGVSLIDNDNYLHPYNNVIKGVPRVTAKVPTAPALRFRRSTGCSSSSRAPAR